MASVSVAEYHGAVSPAGWYEAASATAVFKSGHKYVGAWKAGKMHGRGRYEWVDGVVFEGYFTDNVAEGHGRYDWPDGGRYEGQIRKGKRHGPGVMFFADGATRYEGDWVEGKRHGRGRLIFSDDDRSSATAPTHFYDGEWRDDAKHGSGVFRYPNGDTYEGEWFRDSKHGRGTMRWVGDGRNEMYKGEWKDGKAHGRGAHVWFRDEKNDGASASRFSASANTYVGAFVDGKRHGHGVFSYADGAKYVGDFFEDQKHGQGVYAFEDGSAFRGAFERDRPAVAPGDPPFAPTTFLNLDVHDLLDEISETDAAARAAATEALDKVLLRSMSELRAAYKSAVSASPPSAAEFFPDPSSLSVPGFVAFARRRGVCGADLTVAQMARAIKPAWFAEERRMTHETETKRYPVEVEAQNQEPQPPDPEPSVATTAAADAAETFFLDPRYASAATKDDLAERPLNAADPRETPDALSPNATLAFREFVECLVRCAHAKFLATPGLHRRVEALFRDNAFVDDADALPWDAAMASEDVSRVLRGELFRGDDRKSTDGDSQKDHTPPPPKSGSLHSCFVTASRIRPGDPTRRRDPPAVDGRAFLAFLVDAGVVADADDDGEEVTHPPPEPTGQENEPTDELDADESPNANDERPDETDETDETAESSGAKPEDSEAEKAKETKKNQAVVLTALLALSAFAAAVAPRDALEEARARAEADEAEAEAAALAAYEAEAEREARREAAAARKAEREAAKREAAEAAEAAGEDAAAALDDAAGADDDDDDDDEDAGVSEADLAAAAEAEAKAKAAKKLDVQTQALTRVLDCEATFPEFAEALARCADVAVVGDERSLSLAEKLDAFLAELSTSREYA